MEGRCTCGEVGYRLASAPLFVHCCHCRWCQRETGSAFVLNALIEAERVELLSGRPEVVATPSESGRGQPISRCPACRVALWSVYPGAGPRIRFVRAGTLETPDACPPDIHIFTESRQPWVVLPEGARAVPRYYDRAAEWPAESLARWEACMARPAPAGAAAPGVRRIVPNIAADEVGRARGFYEDVLGLRVAMDLGWIVTFSAEGAGGAQVSVAREGGSGTAVPDLSVEVDDLDAVLARAREAGAEILYGPVEEPWGVRRAYLRDPFRTVVNVLVHV